MIPPRRPWVLQCACGRIRRPVGDALLVCPDCDLIPAPTPEETR